MSDANSSTRWTYNALRNVTNETHTIEGTPYSIQTNQIDAFSRPVQQTIPTNGGTETLNYTYNAMGAFTSLSGTNTYVSNINYNAAGQVTDETLGNGLVQQNCYDANTLRVVDLRAYSGALQSCVTAPPSLLMRLSYVYQPNGNINQMVDAQLSETVNYNYDELDRLRGVNGSYNRTFTYDLIGNITEKDTTSNPGTTGLVSWWKLDETSGTHYDSHGNNDLTDNNAVASTTGIQGAAAQFTAANSQYLSIPDNAALSTGNISFTICTWVDMTSKSSNNIFVAKDDAVGHKREYVLWYSASLDKIRFLVSPDGTNYTTVDANSFGSPFLFTWYLVCAWHDSVNDTINIQVNNGVVDSAPHSTGVYDSTTPFMIGHAVSNSYMDGKIDETAFYKRVS